MFKEKFNAIISFYFSVTVLSYPMNLIGNGLHEDVCDILGQSLVADRETLLCEVASTILIGPTAILYELSNKQIHRYDHTSAVNRPNKDFVNKWCRNLQ